LPGSWPISAESPPSLQARRFGTTVRLLAGDRNLEICNINQYIRRTSLLEHRQRQGIANRDAAVMIPTWLAFVLAFQGHLDQAVRTRDLSVKEANPPLRFTAAPSAWPSRQACPACCKNLKSCLCAQTPFAISQPSGISRMCWPAAYSSEDLPNCTLAAQTAHTQRATGWLCIDKPDPSGPCRFGWDAMRTP
jgi:hypothetical protein